MAKGTLHATATATKKGGITRGVSSKNGKSSIIGSQEGTSTSTTAAAASSKGSKKAKTAATATKATPASKKAAVKPAVSEESADDDDDVVFVDREGADGAPRHLDLKSKKYNKHYNAVKRDALAGMDLCMCLVALPCPHPWSSADLCVALIHPTRHFANRTLRAVTAFLTSIYAGIATTQHPYTPRTPCPYLYTIFCTMQYILTSKIR